MPLRSIQIPSILLTRPRSLIGKVCPSREEIIHVDINRDEVFLISLSKETHVNFAALESDNKPRVQ